MENRAYSILTVKAVEGEQRIIRGIATTPSPDRVGDIVEPLGVKFNNPMPLLHQHDNSAPVGWVKFDKPTASGITFEAHLPIIEETGPLRDRVETAWGEVKAGLVRAVSIGFRALDNGYEVMKGGGIRFLKTEVMELSLVTIPAQADATIQLVKSVDTQQRAALGRELQVPRVKPAASGVKRNAITEGNPMAKKQSLADQIAAFKDTLTEKSERMADIMEEAEGSTLDASQQEEFDGLEAEIGQIQGHIKRLRTLQKSQVETARPVADVDTVEKAADARAVSNGVIHAKPKFTVAKGTAFTRYAMALAAGRGSISDALKHVESKQRWMDETPEVAAYIKADPGTTTDATWAAPLVQPQNLVGEFIELLRPATILGRLPGVRSVPFNVRIPVQTGGSTVNWVGEAAPKPVSELAFDAISLGHNKVAGIVVLTDELVRMSSPSAEETVRRDLVAQVARFLDTQFIDPAVTAGANNPASITNGVTPIAASGSDAEALYWDLNTALAVFDDSDMGTDSITLLMRPGTARSVSMLRNALGQFEFSGITMAGGNLGGFNVITSNSVPAGAIIIIKGDEVLMADDGGVSLDASREATLDMNGGTTPNFNLFQRNAVAIRAERFITWRKRRADAVAVITGAAYGPTAPAAG